MHAHAVQCFRLRWCSDRLSLSYVIHLLPVCACVCVCVCGCGCGCVGVGVCVCVFSCVHASLRVKYPTTRHTLHVHCKCLVSGLFSSALCVFLSFPAVDSRCAPPTRSCLKPMSHMMSANWRW